MGTRSTLAIQDNGTTLVRIYRQMDGYPSGMGKDIATALKGRDMINGYGAQTLDNAFNGAGCMAAALIMSLKADAGIGGIYITDPTDDGAEEYNYTVNVVGDPDNAALQVTCTDGDDELFSGTVDDFMVFCEAD